MRLPLISFLLLVSAALVAGHIHPAERTTRRPWKGESLERKKATTRSQDRQQRSVSSQGNPVCLEGNPLGASYSGNMSQTKSGRTCQAWSAQEPHEHSYTEVGEHNHCRNPFGDPIGVWCYTTDEYKRWEHCSVPVCGGKLKVLDFSADSDQELDSNGEYTAQ